MFFIFCWDAAGLLNVHFLWQLFSLPVSFSPSITVVIAGVMKSMKITGQGLIIGVNNTGNNLSPVTATPAIIYHRCRWHRWTNYRRCHWHRRWTQSCEYLCELSKSPNEIQGPRGNWIMIKTWTRKSHLRLPLRRIRWNCGIRPWIFLYIIIYRWFQRQTHEPSRVPSSPFCDLNTKKYIRLEREPVNVVVPYIAINPFLCINLLIAHIAAESW